MGDLSMQTQVCVKSKVRLPFFEFSRDSFQL